MMLATGIFMRPPQHTMQWLHSDNVYYLLAFAEISQQHFADVAKRTLVRQKALLAEELD